MYNQSRKRNPTSSPNMSGTESPVRSQAQKKTKHDVEGDASEIIQMFSRIESRLSDS